MKLVVAIIRPERLTAVLESLYRADVRGLTLGAVYFLGTTAGAIQTTAPSATGEIVQRLGTAKSATAIRFLDSTVIKRA